MPEPVHIGVIVGPRPFRMGFITLNIHAVYSDDTSKTLDGELRA